MYVTLVANVLRRHNYAFQVHLFRAIRARNGLSNDERMARETSHPHERFAQFVQRILPCI